MCIEYNQLCPETSTWKSKRNRLPTKYPTAAQVTRISDFAIESEIRKRISPPTNLSSCWISITKSKSGFYGFPFYSSIGKSEKGFAKVFSWTVVFFLLIKRARARPQFFKSFVSSDSPPPPPPKKKRKEREWKNRYLNVEIRFQISRSIANQKSWFWNLKLNFQIKRTLVAFSTSADLVPSPLPHYELMFITYTVNFRAAKPDTSWVQCSIAKEKKKQKKRQSPIDVRLVTVQGNVSWTGKNYPYPYL